MGSSQHSAWPSEVLSKNVGRKSLAIASDDNGTCDKMIKMAAWLPFLMRVQLMAVKR